MKDTGSYGEIYWDSFARQREAAGIDGVGTWATLPGDYQEGIQAGAEAVAMDALRRLSPEAGTAPPLRHALVEQMGHRSTIAAVREAMLCGEPMLEVTSLRDGSIHMVSPKSLYEVTWLTEQEARDRVRPWTAAAIGPVRPAGWPDDDMEPRDDDEDDDTEGSEP